jgi:DNA (cytosine-5)-methyltransferase 1
VNELSLFAGAGGGILGGVLLGWRTVCAVEIDPYARRVLLARQNDGILQPFPVYDDVRTFDGKAWRGIVDVVSGGFPCQDISAAGKGRGIEGERSGLWSEMARIIGEVRPKYAFVENSPLLVRRGIAKVLGDLVEMGYDARWGIFSASDVGAPHYRERIFILANSSCDVRALRVFDRDGSESSKRKPLQKKWGTHWVQLEMGTQTDPIFHWKQYGFPPLVRVANDMADAVDRLKVVGNGQVPAVVKLAWETLASPE